MPLATWLSIAAVQHCLANFLQHVSFRIAIPTLVRTHPAVIQAILGPDS